MPITTRPLGGAALLFARQQPARRDRLQSAQGPGDRGQAGDNSRQRARGQRRGDGCSEIRRVPTASIHQVRSPNTMSSPYASAPANPTSAPATASTAPSSRNTARIFAMEKPSARSTPISRMRCSTPSLKKSPVSSSAETIRKKLK